MFTAPAKEETRGYSQLVHVLKHWVKWQRKNVFTAQKQQHYFPVLEATIAYVVARYMFEQKAYWPFALWEAKCSNIQFILFYIQFYIQCSTICSIFNFYSVFNTSVDTQLIIQQSIIYFIFNFVFNIQLFIQYSTF